jgi:hypothetical protein
MNTYSDNLRAAVVDSLRQQELELSTITAQQNAAMFTMFYAQSAVITDLETMLLAKDDQEQLAALKFQGVESATIATNQLAAAQQFNTYVQSSQSNSAICAANVTTAANAILKLAGDVGGIYSNLQASLRDSAIYDLGIETYDLINTTAQLAELSSEIAMNASAKIAEVSSSAVQDMAKATNNSMQQLLKTLYSEYAAGVAVTEAGNNGLAAAKITEKAATGNFTDLATDYMAAHSAYYTMNRELNMNLLATPQHNSMGFPELEVSFNLLQDPFAGSNNKKTNDSLKTVFNLPPTPGVDNYPVDAYYLFFVEDKDKFTFSIQQAENIIFNNGQGAGSGYNIQFGQPPAETKSDIIYGTLDGNTVQLSSLVLYNNGKYRKFYDANGNQVTLGKTYVVFVMATYSNFYKKRLNDFSDFLSAPSATFTPAIQLPTAKVTGLGNDKITFECPDIVKENTADSVQLRAMLLPYHIGKSGILTPPVNFKNLEKVSNKMGLQSASSFQPFNELSFVFNTQIASAVEAGNYIVVVPGKSAPDSDTAIDTNSAAKKAKNSKDDAQPDRPEKGYSVPIDENTTDIFGNKLDFINNLYIATVLTIAGEDVIEKYIPALSGNENSSTN